MMKYIYAGMVSLVVCTGVPAAVSAEKLSYLATGQIVSQGWHGGFEQNPLLYKVADSQFRDPYDLFYHDKVRVQGGDRSTNDKHDSNFSDSGESRDMTPSADMPGSVHGYTGGIDRPFFGGTRPEGDPMVRDLSSTDGGGFSSGSGGGSVPGYNGR